MGTLFTRRHARFGLLLLGLWALGGTAPVAVSQTTVRGGAALPPPADVPYWWAEAGKAAATSGLQGAVGGVFGALTSMAQTAAAGAATGFLAYAAGTLFGKATGGCDQPGSCTPEPESVLD